MLLVVVLLLLLLLMMMMMMMMPMMAMMMLLLLRLRLLDWSRADGSSVIGCFEVAGALPPAPAATAPKLCTEGEGTSLSPAAESPQYVMSHGGGGCAASISATQPSPCRRRRSWWFIPNVPDIPYHLLPL